MTAKFYFSPPAPAQTTPRDVELEFWNSVKDSTSPAVLGTYLESYPDGEFAPIARALIGHFEQKRKAEVAAREQERRRREEQRKAAEVQRLEEERRTREAAIAEARQRAEAAKRAEEIKRLDEQAKAEWLARTEELRKALEEARLARDAAKVAEKERLAAVKAAEEASKAAKATIARKREADEAFGDTTKVAVLPTLGVGRFNGHWRMRWSATSGCGRRDGGYVLTAADGNLSGRNRGGTVSGSISDSGAARWSFPSPADGSPFSCSAAISGDSGSGSCTKVRGGCRMSVTAERLEKVRLAPDTGKAAQPAEAAKEAVAGTREVDGAAGDTTKVAALPKLETGLAEAMQRELQRVGCYRGGIDGVWGPASRSALASFNEHAKMTLPTDTPEEASLSALRKVFAKICPEAQPRAPSPARQTSVGAPEKNCRRETLEECKDRVCPARRGCGLRGSGICRYPKRKVICN